MSNFSRQTNSCKVKLELGSMLAGPNALDNGYKIYMPSDSISQYNIPSSTEKKALVGLKNSFTHL